MRDAVGELLAKQEITEVVFRYEPPRFSFGLTLTLVAFGAVLVLALVGFRRGRP